MTTQFQPPTAPAGFEPSPPASPGMSTILVPLAVGSAVAIALGVYGGLHEPAGFSINVAGFAGTQAVKTWLTTTAFVLALVQIGSALVLYGKIKNVVPPPWLGGLHRWSGRAAVLCTVPVVVHCLYALGFQTATPRVLFHSLLGCFFFGAFAAKMLLLSRPGIPGWALPLIGGALFSGLIGVWLTSALWVFTTVGLPS